MPHFTFNPNDLHPLNRLVFLAGRAALESESGPHRSRRVGDGTDFLDYRPYVAGDDVRKIDWGLYARLRQLFIRLHESPRQLSVSLLVDVSQSMLFGSPTTKLQQAQRLACAMGFIALRGGDRLLASTFSDGLRGMIGPLTGARALSSLIKFLRDAEAGGKSDLLATVRRLRAVGRCRGLVIVCSDFLNVPNCEEAFSTILGGGGRVVAFQVLDDLDWGKGLEGNLRLRDSETGAMVDVHVDNRTLGEYRVKFEARRQLLEAFCNSRGQVYISAGTKTNYLELACTALRAKAVVR
jgi:uncharacterized protein (DUF58 family)